MNDPEAPALLELAELLERHVSDLEDLADALSHSLREVTRPEAVRLSEAPSAAQRIVAVLGHVAPDARELAAYAGTLRRRSEA